MEAICACACACVLACVAACVCEEKQKLTKLLIYAITGAIGEVTRIFFGCNAKIALLTPGLV